MNARDLKVKVREYIATLSDSDLRYLAGKLTDKLQGDLPEALDYLGRNRMSDSILSSAKSAEELYDICDQMGQMFWQEWERRTAA